MRGDVDKVLGREPEVDGNEDCANLRHGVEGLQLLVRVVRDVCNTVPLLDTHALKGGGPQITPVEELRVRETQVAVDDSFPISVKLPCPACELQRRQRSLHALPPVTD